MALMKKLNAIFLVIGILFFAKMLMEYDLAAIFADLSTIGPRFLWVLLLWLLILVVDTITWKHCFGDSKGKTTYLRLGLVNLAGQAINSVAPTSNLGEVVKGKMVVAQAGTAASISSVILYNFLCLVGSVLLIGLGALFALFEARVPMGIRLLLLVSAVTLVGWLLLLMFALNKGLSTRFIQLLTRWKIIKTPEEWLENARHVDRSIRDFRGNHPGDFWICVLAQLASRIFSISEVYVICQILGKPVSWEIALLVMSVSQLLSWVFMMVPSQIGVMEQSSDALFGAMDFQPGTGFTFELVRRARRIVQTFVGLLVLAVLSTTRRSLTKPPGAIGKTTALSEGTKP